MKKLTIACVGDIQFNRPFKLDIGLKHILAESDIVFGNLETPITSGGYPAEKPIVLRTDPRLTTNLKELNLKVATLANNHICDYGYEGMLETIENLVKNDIDYVGAGRDLDEAFRTVKINLKGWNVGFMGVACTLPPSFEAAEKRPGVAPIKVNTFIRIDPVLELEQPGTPPFIFTEPDSDYLNNVVERVVKTRNQQDLDLLVMGIHWGVPFQDNLMDYQVKIADVLLKNGVDLIVGHHPHTLHGVSKYDDNYVFYSVGNFIFHYKPPPEIVSKFSKIMGEMRSSHLSSIIRLKLYDKNDKKFNLEVIPVIIGPDGEPRRCNSVEAKQIFERLGYLSQKFPKKPEMMLQQDNIIKIY